MTCPICRKPSDSKSRPFCSKRCADLDLARWLNGTYAVPSEDPADIDALDEAVEAALRDDLPNGPH
jgi:endogenous inhibitor of DNA gyrase (YacG/DUF329 family)